MPAGGSGGPTLPTRTPIQGAPSRPSGSTAAGTPAGGSPAIRAPGSPVSQDNAPFPTAGVTPTTNRAPAVGGSKSPVTIASIGNYSGPVGSVLGAIPQAVQVWARVINAKGGVNGHVVRLLVYDDGGDPARHKAQAQEAIEKEHAIAFVAEAAPLSGNGSMAYVESKQIPVIGTETGSPWVYQSAMYFPQAPSGDALVLSVLFGLAQRLVPLGKTKLGTVSCAEAQSCRDFGRIFAENAAEVGFQPVYRGQSSLTQPDFTAECIQARNAGVEVFHVAMDTNSVGRVAASCARQGYRPIYNVPASPLADRFKDDPNFDGMIGIMHHFPYFQRGTPATDEYQAAMATYGQSITPGVAAATGWVAAKLFERAAANLPESPSSADVLRGLWSIKDDTLGGLTKPLTFVEGKPAAQSPACWFTTELKNKVWKSLDGFRMSCKAF